MFGGANLKSYCRTVLWNCTIFPVNEKVKNKSAKKMFNISEKFPESVNFLL